MNANAFAAARARIEHRNKGRGRRYQQELAHLVRDARAALVVIDRKVVGYRMTNGEIVCVKERYRDANQAQAALERIQAANWNEHRVPVRAYPCDRCRGFHLTSQAPHAA